MLGHAGNTNATSNSMRCALIRSRFSPQVDAARMHELNEKHWRGVWDIFAQTPRRKRASKWWQTKIALTAFGPVPVGRNIGRLRPKSGRACSARFAGNATCSSPPVPVRTWRCGSP